MARRVGIELSASRCALVDLDERAGGAVRVPARVRTFRTIPWSPQNADAFVATLRLLRKSKIVPARALVALWGVEAACHHFSLPFGDDERLRAQATREVRMRAPADAAGAVYAVLVDGGSRVSRTARDVTVVAAPAAQVRARVAPLLAAGFTIDSVVTPAMALASLARLLPQDGDDGVRAYVAANTDATAVAIVRNGLLLRARELVLPVRSICAADAAEREPSYDALDFARRLAPELRRDFLLLKQQSMADVRQVIICGDFPDPRALAAPLRTSLQVDVATLDGLQGLALGAATPLDAEVRDHAGAVRVAWAAGTAASRHASLLPAGPAAQRDWRGSIRHLAPRAAAVFVLLVALLLIGRTAWMRGGARGRATAAEAPRAERRAPTAPVGATRPAPDEASGGVRVPQVVASANPIARRPTPALAARAPVSAAAADPAPPDPVIDSILYGPDRRLALIGHRVVGIGDRVTAGVIADIEPKAVLVRRPSGEVRRVEMRTK